MCSGRGNWTWLQLGFPIRTPPDHSSVANSPGLIAGSNVLHRLLMPRHPPCALHSLSQQRHNNTRNTHAHTSSRSSTQPKNTRPTPHNQGNRPVRLYRPPPIHEEQATIVRTLHTHHTPHPDQPDHPDKPDRPD